MARARFRRPEAPPGVMSDLGDARPQGDHPRRTPWEERREAREQSQTAAMGVLNSIEAHLGSLLQLQKAPPAGDVLAQISQAIPAAGFYGMRWTVKFQALAIANLSPFPLAVAVDGAQVAGTAPAVGPGVFVVPAGIHRVIATRGNELTIYGAAGQAFDFVAYSRPRPPSSGQIGTAEPFVPGGTYLNASATQAGGANAAAVATLAALATARNWVTSITLVVGAAAAAGSVVATVTGLTGGTLSFEVPWGTGAGMTIDVPLPYPLPSSAVNTAVVVTIPATGAAGPAISATVVGYAF